MKQIILALVLGVSADAALAQCPAPQDTTAREAELLTRLKQAPDAMTAQALNNGLWSIWTEAPNDKAQALLDRGMERREAYDYAAAREALDDLVDYCPDYAEGWNQRAFVLFLQQNFDRALEDLDRVLEMKPDHLGALSGKALTLMSLGRMTLAQDVLRDAVALNPWLPERAYLIEPVGEDL